MSTLNNYNSTIWIIYLETHPLALPLCKARSLYVD